MANTQMPGFFGHMSRDGGAVQKYAFKDLMVTK